MPRRIPLHADPAVITAMLSAGVEPPKEFRIFAAGWNETYKGRFLFDEEAALAVMAEYQEHNVDRQIDLEHMSIDPDAPNYDPDARGWFKLSVRNGELWAVDVTWTPDGEKRMRNRTQRYISPFFGFDKKSRRVQSLYNVAICAIPATKDMPALVAASARSKLELAALSIEANDMEYKKVLAALGLGDDAPFEDLEAALKKLSVGGGDDPEREEKTPEKTADDPEDKELEGLTPKMRGKFIALSSNVSALTKRLEKIEKTQTGSEVDRLISENTDKVPLHMESFLRSQAKKHGIEVVHEFLKTSISNPRPRTPPKEGTKTSDSVQLTKEEKELAKLSGITEEQQLEFKKQRVATDRARQSSHAD